MSNPVHFVREDDFVEYYLFPETETPDIAGQIQEVVARFSKGYIWHKDDFRVRSKSSEAELLHSVLLHQASAYEGDFFHGVSHIGDNIQDEWLIVAILLELTRKIKGLVARVFDSDGEFLLIEAANDHLPDWVKPETCEDKVFLFEGLVHIVLEDDPLTRLRANPSKYCISNAAFEAIQDRIRLFPDQIHETLHRATVFVPTGVAWLLHKRPALISKAVLAFCNRDPIDNRVIRAMKFFPPEDRVYASVTFTKCLYAMLVHNHFIPDRRTGWNLPGKGPDHKPALLGAKLACGFEILACQNRKGKEDLSSNKSWLNYVESLKKRGYFKGFIEGSKDYSSLLDQAQSYFLNHETATSQTHEISELLRDVDSEMLKKVQKTLPREDSDAWLSLSSQDLDEMLEKRYGQASFISSKDADAKLPTVLSEFLEKKSDIEGVEDEPQPKKQGNIDFDANEFQNHMKNLLELVIPEDKWDSNSDMSDYDNDEELEKNLEQMKNDDFEVYLNQMDRELARTTIGKSFEKKNKPKPNESFDDIEEFEPVNIDVNTVKNMMESYKSQLGAAGPASTLLGNVRFDEEKPLKNSQV